MWGKMIERDVLLHTFEKLQTKFTDHHKNEVDIKFFGHFRLLLVWKKKYVPRRTEVWHSIIGLGGQKLKISASNRTFFDSNCKFSEKNHQFRLFSSSYLIFQLKTQFCHCKVSKRPPAYFGPATVQLLIKINGTILTYYSLM